MPIYEYKAIDPGEGTSCEYCRGGYEKIHKSSDIEINCPECKGAVRKLISRVGVAYGLDFRAKNTGLHKLVRRDKGTYEKMY